MLSTCNMLALMVCVSNWVICTRLQDLSGSWIQGSDIMFDKML